jgi:hypothetical protein
LIVASALCLLEVLVPRSVRAADTTVPADPRPALLALWRGQHAEIVTARFRTKCYRYATTEGAVTRDQVVKTLEGLNLANQPEDWAKLRNLFPAPPADFTEFWGTPVEILQEGSKGRNNWKYSAQTHAVEEMRVFNNQEDIEYSAFNKQALILPGRSSVELITAKDIRYLPKLDPQDGPEHFAILKRSAGRITLQKANATLVVDEANGFIYHLSRSLGKGELQEVYQFGPRKYAGDVLLPSARLEMYAGRDGKLQWLSGSQLLEAEINIALPENTFVLDVPADTNVVDFRKDSNRPNTRITREAVSDVVAFANAALAQRGQADGTQTLSPRRILWLTTGCVLGLGLLVLGIRLLRKPRTAA